MPATRRVVMSTEASHDGQIPDVLDERYTDYERMASGGMGVVYKAYDSRLDKVVAIKTVLVDQMTPDMILRFQQEARAASRLTHPNLITVLDFGMTEKNKPFLVMEFVEGDSLESRLNSGVPLPLDEAAWILCQICDGMSHAHKTGVIHRDLKPSNVMLLRNCRPEDPNVRIVDFGIAKIKDLFNTDERVTKTGAMLGSPFYVSPEQINNSDVDPRADIYSLGCIMYRMFAGQPPFEGETYIETITAHLKKPVPNIPDDVDIPSKLKSLIFQCLSKSPDGRPETMDALADELNTICGESDEILASGRFQLPNLGAKQLAPPSKSTFLTKNKLIAGAAVLLLLVGTGAAAVLMQKAPVTDHHGKTSKKTIETIDPMKFTLSEDGKKITATKMSALEDADFDALRGLKLTTIQLNDSNATDATVKRIRELELKSLRGLDLGNTNITDDCIDDINAMTTLQNLRVPLTKVTDTFVKKLRLPLTWLDLDECKITDEGFQAISENIPALVRLEASATKITINGIKSLSRLRRLRNLYLSNIVIDDDVINVLKTMPSLSALTLTEAQMSKHILKRLPELKKLTYVELSHVANADGEVLKWLKQHMPGCTIGNQKNVADKQLKEDGMSELINGLGHDGVEEE